MKIRDSIFRMPRVGLGWKSGGVQTFPYPLFQGYTLHFDGRVLKLDSYIP